MCDKFDKEMFIKLLNRKTLLTKEGEFLTISDWAETDIRRAFVLPLECSFNLYLHFEIVGLGNIEYTNRFFDEEHFDAVLTEILLDMKYSCFLLKPESGYANSGRRIFKPIDDKGAELLGIFEVLAPYVTMYPSAYVPRIKFEHLRHELTVDFIHVSGSIDVHYFKDHIASLTSKADAEAFMDYWLKKGQVIDRIIDDALEIAKKYDPSAFLHQGNICAFSHDLRLGFSFYKEADTFFYFFTSFLPLDGLEFTTDNVEELSERVLTYFKKSLNVMRLPAIFNETIGNYLYRLLTQIFGYYDSDFNEFFYDSAEFAEARRYVDAHFNDFALEEISSIACELPKDFNLEKAYRFGNLLFLIEVECEKKEQIKVILDDKVLNS
jgi:hypothetical protein